MWVSVCWYIVKHQSCLALGFGLALFIVVYSHWRSRRDNARDCGRGYDVKYKWTTPNA